MRMLEKLQTYIGRLLCRSWYLYIVLHIPHTFQVRVPLQAAAAAAANSRGASAGGGGGGGDRRGNGIALSWTAALYTTAVLHAGPAATAFAISAWFQHNVCAPTAVGAVMAVDRHSTAGGTMQRLLGSSQGGVAAAAGCALAAAAWRHARSAAAGPLNEVSAGSTGDKVTGGAGSKQQRSAASSGLLGRAVTAALGYRAALGGCGWRRLKSALLTAVVRHKCIRTCVVSHAARLHIRSPAMLATACYQPDVHFRHMPCTYVLWKRSWCSSRSWHA